MLPLGSYVRCAQHHISRFVLNNPFSILVLSQIIYNISTKDLLSSKVIISAKNLVSELLP
jgi:hypothetical protein